MHGTQAGIVSINASILACGDHPIDDCPGLPHESLNIIADQRMNAGLDGIRICSNGKLSSLGIPEKGAALGQP